MATGNSGASRSHACHEGHRQTPIAKNLAEIRKCLPASNPPPPNLYLSVGLAAMARDKSEKKEKRSKEVTETVTESIVAGADVDMEDVEMAKVSL